MIRMDPKYSTLEIVVGMFYEDIYLLTTSTRVERYGHITVDQIYL